MSISGLRSQLDQVYIIVKKLTTSQATQNSESSASVEAIRGGLFDIGGIYDAVRDARNKLFDNVVGIDALFNKTEGIRTGLFDAATGLSARVLEVSASVNNEQTGLQKIFDRANSIHTGIYDNVSGLAAKILTINNSLSNETTGLAAIINKASEIHTGIFSVNGLSSSINNVKSVINTVSTTVNTINTATSLISNIKSATDNITTLQNSIASLNTTVTNIKLSTDTLASISTTIGSINTNVNSSKTKVDSLHLDLRGTNDPAIAYTSTSLMKNLYDVNASVSDLISPDYAWVNNVYTQTFPGIKTGVNQALSLGKDTRGLLTDPDVGLGKLANRIEPTFTTPSYSFNFAATSPLIVKL